MPPLVIYIDVDDTFVRSVGTKRIPLPGTIAQIRRLKTEGAVLYCWSSGGAEYAQASAEEWGIADCFVAFLPKPQVLIDDQTVQEWRQLLQVAPSDKRGADEYRQALFLPSKQRVNTSA